MGHTEAPWRTPPCIAEAVRRCSPNSSALRAGACLDEDGGNNVDDGVVDDDHRSQVEVLVLLVHSIAGQFSLSKGCAVRRRPHIWRCAQVEEAPGLADFPYRARTQ